MKACIIGTGYVGLVTGACLAENGNDVWCVDVDHSKIEGLKEGKASIYEPGLDELVANNVRQNRLFFTTDLTPAVRGADAVFIAVGTSLGVYPAAGLLPLAIRHGAPAIIVNAQETPYDDYATAVIREPIADALPWLLTGRP